jgi:hypothetical protein
VTVTDPSEIFAAPACARNRFTPVQRFAILFGVGFGLKYALRLTSVGAPIQALVVAGATTALLWALWSAGAGNRRLMLGITVMLWVATAAKFVRV